jgi:hypothetical protein
MVSRPKSLEEGRVLQRLAPTIGLLAAMVPAVAQAQVNIDQGKSPSEIFANDCAACHKSTRGLASGKNSLTLTSFLREHYTASREQAAALAAYVLGAGGGEALKPGQKPGQERAKVEEPKGRPVQQSAKPEVEAPTAKLQPPAGEEAKPEEQPGGMRPTSASHGRKNEKNEHDATPPPPQPATVVAAPAAGVMQPSGTPSSEANPATGASPANSAAAPAEPAEGEPVPRDNIPD